MAIANMIEAEIPESRGNPNWRDSTIPQNFVEVNSQETRDIATRKVGFNNRETYRQAKAVAESCYWGILCVVVDNYIFYIAGQKQLIAFR
ncbi:MAG: hypothetical protein V3U75_06190 [Methylococcaceae bacterium]